MSEDTLLPFHFPAVARKKVFAAFDGGRLTSDGGVLLLLAAAERRLGIADKLAALISDPRDPNLVKHSVADILRARILRARILAIACGYEDGNDLDRLRFDPGFKLACGRLPDSGADLCSQPTVSRWENAPDRREVAAMSYALIDIYCASYARPPREITLDIDDTVDVVHGTQQLSLFNSHYGERCFLPMHVYETATGRPVAVLLRSGKTPSGREVRGQIRRLVRRIRTHWPATKITIRGDGHYGRHEAMTWCEANGVDYIFGLGGNDAIDRKLEAAADDVRVRWAEGEHPVLRRYAETRHGAASWKCERRVAARIEASCNGLDIRYVVTNIRRGSAEWLYDTLYCERGQAENLIKLHKTQLASDRTSCHTPFANQVRLVLHTAAYWLLLTLRDAIPKPQVLARAEFKTLRLSLIKIAARVIETATRVRIAFAASCPEAELFVGIARRLQPADP
jgi:hypothetical protein